MHGEAAVVRQEAEESDCEGRLGLPLHSAILECLDEVAVVVLVDVGDHHVVVVRQLSGDKERRRRQASQETKT